MKNIVEKIKLYDEMISLIEKRDEEFEKIYKDRLKYGYNSICTGIRCLVNELAFEKAKDKNSGYWGDLEYWRNYYSYPEKKLLDTLKDLLDIKE